MLWVIAFIVVYWVAPALYTAATLKIEGCEYCCMVRPWHAHFVGNIDPDEDCDGWAGIGFSVTERDLNDEELGETLAHEHRHVMHAYVGGIIYDLLYEYSDTFSKLAEWDCERAEHHPLQCKNRLQLKQSRKHK